MSNEEQPAVEYVLPKVAHVMRLRTGAGRKAFAERLGVSREQVRAYEQPSNNTSEKTLQRYAEAAGRRWPEALWEEMAAWKAGKWPPLSKEDEERESAAPPEPEKAPRKRRSRAG